MLESSSWQKLRPLLTQEASSRGSSIHIVRVENLLGAGIFDSNVCFKGVEFWLEGKYLRKWPVRPSSLVKVGLREEQEAFAIRRLYAGGRCFVWLHVEFDNVFGSTSSLVKSGGRSGKKAAKPLVGLGKGWYLIELSSAETISKCHLGMEQSELLLLGFNTAKELASGFLNLFV